MVRRLNSSIIKDLRLLSNSICRCTVKFYKHVIFINVGRPSSFIFMMDCSYPSIKQSYCESNVVGHGYGSIQDPATCEQIIILNNIFIDNPILSPILVI